MRMLRWLIRFIAAAALLSALIGTAAAVGRAASATIVSARGRNSAPGWLDAALIDVSRGLSLTRRIAAPFALDIDWAAVPPQVVQRAASPDGTAFTLSHVDIARARLAALVRYTVTDGARDLEIALAGTRAAVFEPTSGDVTVIDPGGIRHQIPVEPGTSQMLTWSPDGQRLAIKDFREPLLTLWSGEGARRVDVFRDSGPLWSPDGRFILFTQDSFVERNGRLRAYDAASGEIVPTVNDVAGRTGVWCDSETLGFVRATADGRHTVQVMETTTGALVEALDADGTAGQEILSLTFAPRADCKWLLLTMRFPNALTSRLYRLDIAGGELTLLGENARILSLSADAVVFDSNTANVALSVARAAFEAGAALEIYGRIPSQIEDVTWFDDFRRGLFLRSGELWLADLTTGRTASLPFNRMIAAFQIVPAN